MNMIVFLHLFKNNIIYENQGKTFYLYYIEHLTMFYFMKAKDIILYCSYYNVCENKVLIFLPFIIF